METNNCRGEILNYCVTGLNSIQFNYTGPYIGFYSRDDLLALSQNQWCCNLSIVHYTSIYSKMHTLVI